MNASSPKLSHFAKANYTGSTFEHANALLHVLHRSSNCEAEPEINKVKQQSAAMSTYNFFRVLTALEQTVVCVTRSNEYSNMHHNPACVMVSSVKQ